MWSVILSCRKVFGISSLLSSFNHWQWWVNKSPIFFFFLLLWRQQLKPFFHFSQASESVQFSSVQSLSSVQLFVTPWTAACRASLSIINSRSSLKLMSSELVMLSNHVILYRPLLLLPSVFKIGNIKEGPLETFRKYQIDFGINQIWAWVLRDLWILRGLFNTLSFNFPVSHEILLCRLEGMENGKVPGMVPGIQ